MMIEELTTQVDVLFAITLKKTVCTSYLPAVIVSTVGKKKWTSVSSEAFFNILDILDQDL